MRIPNLAYVVAAVVLASAVFIGRLAGGTPSSLAFLATGAVMLALAVGLPYSTALLRDLSRRSTRFSVSRKGFYTRPFPPPQLFVLICVVGVANQLGIAMERLRHDRTFGLILTGCTAIFVAVAGIAALWVIGRSYVHLTPTGITWGYRPFRRRVGWDELAPGSPQRPLPSANSLGLETTRGRRSFSLRVDVHPALLADAIRWYAEHPEHRAGIGTEAEHERLLTALGTVGAQTV